MTRSGLRSADDLLASVVDTSIRALTLQPEDAAVVRLARQYAAAIDADPDQLDALGPKLLAALNALGASPAGRTRLKGGAPTRAESRLTVLRQARR